MAPISSTPISSSRRGERRVNPKAEAREWLNTAGLGDPQALGERLKKAADGSPLAPHVLEADEESDSDAAWRDDVNFRVDANREAFFAGSDDRNGFRGNAVLFVLDTSPAVVAAAKELLGEFAGKARALAGQKPKWEGPRAVSFLDDLQTRADKQVGIRAERQRIYIEQAMARVRAELLEQAYREICELMEVRETILTVLRQAASPLAAEVERARESAIVEAERTSDLPKPNLWVPALEGETTRIARIAARADAARVLAPLLALRTSEPIAVEDVIAALKADPPAHPLAGGDLLAATRTIAAGDPRIVEAIWHGISSPWANRPAVSLVLGPAVGARRFVFEVLPEGQASPFEAAPGQATYRLEFGDASGVTARAGYVDVLTDFDLGAVRDIARPAEVADTAPWVLVDMLDRVPTGLEGAAD